MIYRGIEELVGNTPLVTLNKYCAARGAGAEIVAKAEFFNPAGSVKDRVALHKRWRNNRTHVGQHRHRPCRHRLRKGLPRYSHHARKYVVRKAQADCRIRRGDSFDGSGRGHARGDRSGP